MTPLLVSLHARMPQPACVLCSKPPKRPSQPHDVLLTCLLSDAHYSVTSPSDIDGKTTTTAKRYNPPEATFRWNDAYLTVPALPVSGRNMQPTAAVNAPGCTQRITIHHFSDPHVSLYENDTLNSIGSSVIFCVNIRPLTKENCFTT